MPNPETTLDNRHSLALPYWARPGVALFAKKTDDEGGDDDEGDNDEDDEGDDDDDEDEDKTDEELKAELKELRTQLSKASGSSKSKRDRIKKLIRENEELRTKGTPKPKGKAKNDDDDEIDVEAIRETAKLEGQKAAEAKTKRIATIAALADAGVPKESRARLAAMVRDDVDDLDLDDDGTLDGIDDVIADLRKELPALFAPTRKRRSIAGDDDRSGDEKKDKKPKSASQRQADQILKGGR